MDEIAAVLQDRLTPAAAGAVIDILRNEEIAMREEQEETSRMERMISIIDECDEIVLLDKEGSCVIKPDGLLDSASQYLYNLRDIDVKDPLDAKARTVALYVIATMEGPYDGGYELVQHWPDQPIDKVIIKNLMKDFVVNKHGVEAWSSSYDNMEFDELFDDMTYFDGENPVEILRHLSLIDEIREELLQQGFALKDKTGEEK